MSKEASKTNKIRGKEFAVKYLQGSVLDIGAGGDLVCDWARSFDIEDGDANNITDYISAESYDVVHSSHCLEHMFNPTEAILGWWSVVKPGGYMIIVVPEENLYEQGAWPPIFNQDHKSTFRLGGETSWSPVSFDIKRMCESLPGATVVSAELQDHNYNRRLILPRGVKPFSRLPIKYKWIFSLAKRVPFYGEMARKKYREYLVTKGWPIDQTKLDALAQIQIIVRKLR
jgi:SAM-dependent methyltransferase